jgi:hypothetical protein
LPFKKKNVFGKKEKNKYKQLIVDLSGKPVIRKMRLKEIKELLFLFKSNNNIGGNC